MWKDHILLCFDYYDGITNEEEDLMFDSEFLNCFLLIPYVYP